MMKKKSVGMVLALSAFLMLTGATTALAQGENKNIVSTTCGLVSGIMQEGTMAYLGIPYARVERCMPPLPVEPWEGVRACDHWGQ